jgi:hypothetical protein
MSLIADLPYPTEYVVAGDSSPAGSQIISVVKNVQDETGIFTPGDSAPLSATSRRKIDPVPACTISLKDTLTVVLGGIRVAPCVGYTPYASFVVVVRWLGPMILFTIFGAFKV